VAPEAVDVPSGGDVDRERGAVLRAGVVVEVKVRRRVEVGCRGDLGGEIVHGQRARRRLYRQINRDSPFLERIEEIEGLLLRQIVDEKRTSGPTP